MTKTKTTILFFFIALLGNISFAQEWVEVASLPNAFNKTHHSFGFALEGKGYIVSGGSDIGERSDFYQYDAEMDTWTYLGDFPGGTRSFSIGDTWDGKAYFGFGTNDDFGDLNDLWVFDPADMSWTELASCPCEARTHPAFVAQDGKVFVGLGGGGSSGNKNDWWEYDIATDTWSQKPNFPSAPRHHPFQFGIDGFIYVGFGHGNGFISNQWYQYDPVNETWLEVQTLPAEGRVAGTQFSHNGLGYILSGDGQDHLSMEEGEFWSYDPIVDEWTQLLSHPSKSRWAPASFVINDEVYLINGDIYINNNYVYQTEVYKYSLVEIVSTDDFENQEAAFEVFPNPFSGHLNIKWQEDVDFTDASLQVFDIHSRLVFETHNLNTSLDLSHLPNGWLRMEVKNNDQLYFQTVLKQ